MQVSLFDFVLPEEHIALRPLQNREEAKLLYVNKEGSFADYKVGDLPNLLRPDDVLVLNNTKVIAANLQAIRKRFDETKNEEKIAHININLHKHCAPNQWRAFAKPLKRLAIGEKLYFLDQGAISDLSAILLEKYDDGEVLLEFNLKNPQLNEAISKIGQMPLPPYIATRRRQDGLDNDDYQTVFAKEEGAVAAPTAGLHFTKNLLAKLAARGIEHYFLTLHVGAGTFLPVKVENINDHKMHSEIGYLPEDIAAKLNKAKKENRRIIAVGTTSLRLLESSVVAPGRIEAWSGPTDIFITPGYKFGFVDGLITNFHLPKSTLFMLVSAFAGLETMKKAYAHAIDKKYRFYSYGDTSFLELNKTDI